jgi:hypothetical protein
MRRLFVPAGFSSMRDYCVGVLRLSEDAAYKRIHAARAAREFPAIFTMVAEGRLHLAGACLLAPHLTPENGPRLLAAAEHQTKAEIERLIAERFPQSEMLGLVEAIPGPATMPDDRLAPGPIDPDAPERVGESTNSLAPGQVEAPAPRSMMKPHAPGAFALRLVIGQRTHDRLRYAQELMSHRNSSGDLAEAIDQLLDIAIPCAREAQSSRRPRSPGAASAARRPTRATSPRTSGTRSGSAMVGSARSSASRVIDVRSGGSWNSTTPFPWHAGGKQPWRTCACAVVSTISSRRNAPSAPASWTRSGKRLVARRRPSSTLGPRRRAPLQSRRRNKREPWRSRPRT